MTTQMTDNFLFGNAQYSILEPGNVHLFNPALVGLQPSMATTACYRGHVALYALENEHLVINDLMVNLRARETGVAEQGPTINGIQPELEDCDYALFNNRYRELNLPLAYTGHLIIGDGYIQYGHQMLQGSGPVYYDQVVELNFDAGRLTHQRDLSARMAAARRRRIEDIKRSTEYQVLFQALW